MSENELREKLKLRLCEEINFDKDGYDNMVSVVNEVISHEPKHETVEQWEAIETFKAEEDKSYYVFDNHKRLVGIGIMQMVEGAPFWSTLHDTVLHNFCVTHVKQIKDLPVANPNHHGKPEATL